MKGARMSGRDLQRARKTAKAQVEERIRRQARRITELERALQPFATYAKKRDALPLTGMGDSVHKIHTGTKSAAEITMKHCRRALRLLTEKD